MSALDQHLQAAISQYQELLGVMTALTEPGILDEGIDLPGLSARLVNCQIVARKTDRDLLQVLDQGAPSSSQLPLLREYQDLLRQVAERNLILLDRARTHCALVAAELSELRGAKAAVSGYRLPVESRGGRLSDSY